jgi:hypothetical protein
MNPLSDPVPQASEPSHCESCGRNIPKPEAVCIQCDQESAAASAAIPPGGKYPCPACSQTFEKPRMVLVPADAKWYVPQVQASACPHCCVRLRDVRTPHLSQLQVVGLFVFAVCAPLLVPADYATAARTCVVICLLTIYASLRSWGVPDSRRYVPHEA